MSIVKTEKLCVGYEKKVVIDGIDISGMKGEIVCLLGPNGAGKTTILRTISGLLTPIRGEVYIKGEKILHINKKELSKQLAVVLTQKLSGGLMTAFEIAAMGRYPHTDFFGKLTESDIEKTFDALKTVNAECLSERYFDELSDGEKQKILVARALVQEPEVIVLDEPTSHLDIRHRLELMDILKKLSKEREITVILSLHEIDMALKSCDKVVLVKGKRVVAYGVPEEVVNEEIINQLYSIKESNFNNLLGSIEICNSEKSSVFVIGGSGYGAPIYRVLTKYGIGVSTGVLHQNDVDYEIARTMGLTISSEKAFEEISDEKLSCCKKIIDEMDIVIDSGFPVGNINKRNRDLITYALKKGKKVITLRDKEEAKSWYEDKNIVYCSSISEIIERLKHSTEQKWREHPCLK